MSENAVLDPRKNPYASYGAKAAMKGQFLSFNRFGEWTFGQSSEVLAIGTRLIVNMPGFRVGWRRWFNKKIESDLTELLSEGPRIQQRDELGNTDMDMWERDKDGKPVDPWQFINAVEMSDGENTFLYATGSIGGRHAMGDLCIAYGKQWAMNPEIIPIIELGADHYNHPQYKKTFVPLLTVVGWTNINRPSLDDADNDGLAVLNRLESPGQRDANPIQAAQATTAQPEPSKTSTTISPSDEAEAAYMAAGLASKPGEASKRAPRF